MPSVEETLMKGPHEFSDINIIPQNSQGVTGTLYIKKNTNPSKGIVFLHGMWGTREDLDFFLKRLADQNYCVYAINLPAHGEDINDFNIALASEYISIAVKFLRSVGMRRVCVIGYSIGAVASIFAACGYNRRLERDIYVLFERCKDVAEKIVELEKKREVSDVVGHIRAYMREKSERIRSELREWIKGEIGSLEDYQRQFEETFKELKRVILEALKQQRFSNQRIDSMVLIGIPLGIQDAMSIPAPVFKIVSTRVLKRILDLLNKSVRKFLEQEGLLGRYSGPNRELIESDFLSGEQLQWLFLRIRDINKLADYTSEIKNPRDYLGMINFFSRIELEKYEEKEREYIEESKKAFTRMEYRAEAYIQELKESPPILSFIRRYKRDIIDNVPKLIVHGCWDQFSRPFLRWRRKSIAQYYNSLGRVIVVKYERMMHLFDAEGFRLGGHHPLSYPRMAKDIVNFLNQTL